MAANLGPRAPRRQPRVVASWLVVFSPQMVVWFVLYGRPFTVPQGPSFMQWTSPHPLAVLFSDSHGLFVWAPLLVAVGHRADWIT